VGRFPLPHASKGRETSGGGLLRQQSVQVILRSGAEVHERTVRCIACRAEGQSGKPRRPVRKTKVTEGEPNQSGSTGCSIDSEG